jgi:hypothetical protein
MAASPSVGDANGLPGVGTAGTSPLPLASTMAPLPLTNRPPDCQIPPLGLWFAAGERASSVHTLTFVCALFLSPHGPSIPALRQNRIAHVPPPRSDLGSVRSA